LAVIYLSSVDGNDSDNGTTWALAKATLAAALTAAGAGGTVYVDNAHAESQASLLTLTSPGTAASPVRVICSDRTGNPEPPTARATTATVSTTGNNSIAIGNSGVTYIYGVALQSGSGANATLITSGGSTWFFDTCAVKLTGTSGGYIQFSGGYVELNNTPFYFNSTGQTVYNDGPVVWKNTANAIAGTAVPTTLFTNNNAGPTQVIGVDLSAAGSGKNLVNIAAATKRDYRFANCKLGASVSYATGSVAGVQGNSLEMLNCDSADTNYKYYFQNYAGIVRDETTIVCTGGSTDGTTPVSYKFVTTANSKFYAPLYGPWVTFFVNSTGSITLAAEVVTDNVTLTDADAWIEVESLNNGSYPISSLSNDQVTDPIFGSAANQTTSSVTWTTTGLTTPVKQTLSKAVTTAEKGPIRARVVLAKASTTMYADNLRLASSARQWMSWSGNYINDPVASGGPVGQCCM
jgi:hypothetical protein